MAKNTEITTEYKTYCLHVSNYGGVAEKSTRPGYQSVSKAVEAFLQEVLKKPDLEASIEVHETTVRRI